MAFNCAFRSLGRMAAVLAFCLAAGLPVWIPSALAQPEVSEVRVGVHPDKTRFVLGLSESVPFRVFTLADPYRVVIDFPELSWTAPPDALNRPQGQIAAMRYGLFTPGTSRIVLDLTRPGLLKDVLLLPPRDGHRYRFVVDIEAVDRAGYFRRSDGKMVASARALQPLQQARLPLRKPAPPGDARPVIVIDPGHGGVDPGAIGVSGLYEKDIALSYAKALKARLEQTGRYQVVMTRDRDIFVQLRDRIAIAQRAGGDLFVSLHANTHPSSKIRGASVYTLSENASDKEAAALAAKENKADIIGGINLSDQPEVVSKILIDLAQRETMNHSKRFASMLIGEVGKETKLLRKSHRFAGFAVLKSPTVPSVLFEIGYMTSAAEERLLRSSKHRGRIAEALTRSIDAYFKWRTSLSRS